MKIIEKGGRRKREEENYGERKEERRGEKERKEREVRQGGRQ